MLSVWSAMNKVVEQDGDATGCLGCRQQLDLILGRLGLLEPVDDIDDDDDANGNCPAFALSCCCFFFLLFFFDAVDEVDDVNPVPDDPPNVVLNMVVVDVKGVDVDVDDVDGAAAVAVAADGTPPSVVMITSSLSLFFDRLIMIR
ncbi:hypothetical protein DFA_03604 [Cavenderia fasciculata]|uniref:Uncharacterized protein n=1 Tax=Cavenderia fasciculata TaxID=261658 RepID=F4PI72_CACFS|nr:uncharacterized protein DFA_03604 [Cavenderia fasciculata]EGG25355.1 hypothetical protein DFA_03604 [Cavenderia fasciculata]|eukprot:XP_004363206.1 hypothetical protein DFA_03604 [Cavenderia fasciculata]